VLISVDQVGAVLKASFLYTYSPYVTDNPMTLFLEEESVTLARDQASLVLLEPQEFMLDLQHALTLAAEHGLDQSGDYRVELYLGGETGGRFVWRFLGPVDGSAIEAPPGALLDIAIDVQDGRIHFWELVGISEGHG
jgi:hypothetical protein